MIVLIARSTNLMGLTNLARHTYLDRTFLNMATAASIVACATSLQDSLLVRNSRVLFR